MSVDNQGGSMASTVHRQRNDEEEKLTGNAGRCYALLVPCVHLRWQILGMEKMKQTIAMKV